MRARNAAHLQLPSANIEIRSKRDACPRRARRTPRLSGQRQRRAAARHRRVSATCRTAVTGDVHQYAGPPLIPTTTVNACRTFLLNNKNRLELKRDRSCRRSAWLGRRRRGWTLVPSDAGRAFFGGGGMCVAQLRAPSPNCGCCGFKVRVSRLLRKRGFAV